MTLPTLYFSRPATVLPEKAMDNDEVLALVRDEFTGPDAEWNGVEQTIRYVFDRCNTKTRYLDQSTTLLPSEFATQAAQACLDRYGVAATDLDLVVYGGIARGNFEPATAAEVAGMLGARPLHAVDVTCACAGLIEAMHTVAGYFALHPEMTTALICSGELSRGRIAYDMRGLQDVAVFAAGLTLGNAATALLITREPMAGGSARLEGIFHKTLCEHYDLCKTPIDGFFQSKSKELFALSVHAAPLIKEMCDDIGWSTEEVDHYAFHQPSEAALERVFTELGARPQACVHTHSLFGNTASTAWALALDYRLEHGTVEPGDKIVMASAAAGFTIVGAAATWEG
ncbi:hypothetical protein FK535_16630 [Mycolicibacterium sp. 018/SC-01/001]|uniref:3-oxoacyl-ACP synthase III family protein n=1 Tax=Mycolicibacterium sp. 018/SC-01/001 TaxID=2592069 RepID=UPI00117ECC44|nr:3-oxoacyl-[acyl-carrier-protein] synthase III C-terminal domain-containing protein [Mycolicibacterium sp. 018/SC-01/001]TRW81508.1 hypothetical protein FK535_16630 [Mycolicibacterium sp. 018/SC-01/001]